MCLAALVTCRAAESGGRMRSLTVKRHKTVLVEYIIEAGHGSCCPEYYCFVQSMISLRLAQSMIRLTCTVYDRSKIGGGGPVHLENEQS